MAEGEGFEPSRRLKTPYSLSRRALSAAQSSLRDPLSIGTAPPVPAGPGPTAVARSGSGGAIAQVTPDVPDHHPPLVLVEVAVHAHELATLPAEVGPEHDRPALVGASVVVRVLLLRRRAHVAHPVEAELATGRGEVAAQCARSPRRAHRVEAGQVELDQVGAVDLPLRGRPLRLGEDHQVRARLLGPPHHLAEVSVGARDVSQCGFGATGREREVAVLEAGPQLALTFEVGFERVDLLVRPGELAL